MKGKFFFILILIALLAYTVYKMLEYEQEIRSGKVVTEYIEDDRAPLVEQPSAEVLNQLANRVNYYFQTEGDGFRALQFSNESKTLTWEPFLLKGVNLGVAVPGKFPAEFSLSM
ncbi:MAG: hypothetical protein KDD99_28895, partial [Bacteroidetes bacterium]|nr:hypothetical protein [Bacteroidota bacterium]